MISVMFTIINVTVHGVCLPPWRSPLSLFLSLSSGLPWQSYLLREQGLRGEGGKRRMGGKVQEASTSFCLTLLRSYPGSPFPSAGLEHVVQGLCYLS